jgi:hypothetical protein
VYYIFKQLNPEKFAEFIFDMKDCLPPEASIGRVSPYLFFDIPKELKKEIISTKHLTNELKERIILLIKDIEPIDKIKIEKLQKFWDENVNDLFFQEMEKYMPGCSVSKYICYITDKIVGSYFEKDNEVVAKFMKDKGEVWISSVVAEEILHLIYWKFWRNLFNRDLTLDERVDIGNDEINGWSISEIIPDYLLTENRAFEKLGWLNIDRCEEGYHWIKDLREKLDPLWAKKENFSDFVIRVHLLCGFTK